MVFTTPGVSFLSQRNSWDWDKCGGSKIDTKDCFL